MRHADGDLTTAGPFADGGMELLGIEPLEEHARRLAALLTVSIRGRVNGGAHLRRLDGHMRALRQVYVGLTDAARRGEQPSPAGEWLLDNFHIISAAARDIHHDLPPAFFGGCRGSRPTSSPGSPASTRWRSSSSVAAPVASMRSGCTGSSPPSSRSRR